jgi:tight adherence protein B
VTDALTAAILVGVSFSLAAGSLAARSRALVRTSILGSATRETARRDGWPGIRRLALVPAAVAGAVLAFGIAGPAGALAAAIGIAVGPPLRRRRRRAAEAVALEDGLAEAVSAIAAALRAGRSMAGALEEAAATVPPPLGPRLRVLVDRVALGVPVESAILELADSVPGPDGRLVVAVLGLHQRAGGDAPSVLDRVARTLRERRASAREVRSLTAQARLSGAILGFLPIGFFLFLSVTARADVDRAIASPTGRTAIVVGLAMQAVAFLWIRRLLRVDA